MNKPFTRIITKTEYRHEAIYAVHGFWSGDNVRMSKRRDLLTSGWTTPEINWSTGGADKEEEPDRIKAAENFSAAIKDAVKLARKWEETK